TTARRSARRPPLRRGPADRAVLDSIVSDDSILKEDVLLLRSAADVVKDQGRAPEVSVRDDPDVQDAAPEVPGHDVAGTIRLPRLESVVDRDLVPLEVPHQVG